MFEPAHVSAFDRIGNKKNVPMVTRCRNVSHKTHETNFKMISAVQEGKTRALHPQSQKLRLYTEYSFILLRKGKWHQSTKNDIFLSSVTKTCLKVHTHRLYSVFLIRGVPDIRGRLAWVLLTPEKLIYYNYISKCFVKI